MTSWTIAPPVRNNVRLATSVPITTNTPGNPPLRVTAGQLRLTLNAGDIVLLTSTVETRVNMEYPVLSAGFIRYTVDGQYVVPGEPLHGDGIIARPMGWNVWDDPHYRVDLRTAFFQAPTSGVYVFQHVVYGASSAYTGNPEEKMDIVYVEQYGLVLRPDTTADEVLLSLAARIAALEALNVPGN